MIIYIDKNTQIKLSSTHGQNAWIQTEYTGIFKVSAVESLI